jgi:hypothetical protein
MNGVEEAVVKISAIIVIPGNDNYAEIWRE